MKKLFANLKSYKKEVILAPLFKMLEALFELLVPIVVSQIIDVGINGNGGSGYIIKMGVVLVFLAIVGLAFAVTAQYFAAKAAVGFAKKTRSCLFNKMQSLSFSEIDKLGTSSMITRMTNDVNQIQNGVNMVLRLLLRSPIVVFGAIIMAFIVDAKSAIIFVIEVPILALVVFAIIFATLPMHKSVQSKLEKVVTKTRENLTGVRVIRAFALEEKENEDFTKEQEGLYKQQKVVGIISGLLNPLTYVIVNLAIVALIYIGAIRVNQGNITQGQVVALYNYMSQILIELVKLANLIVNLTKSIASGKRVEEVLNMESSLIHKKSEGENESEYEIEFNNVDFKYKTASEESLQNIDLKIKKGETVGIIGGTGSGKTSLISLIPHFYDATKGEVLVEGKNVQEYDDETLRDKIGFVLQKSVLFKGTIKENLKWGNENASEEDMIQALKTAQAYDVVLKKEKGLDSEVEQLGKNFSGGQKQRLAIARALIKKPSILILDDSSSALDYATDAKLRKELKKLNYNPTIIVVSQRTASIQHADKIVVLDDGKIDGIGTHKQLLNTSKVYKEIYDSQFKEGGSKNDK